VGWIRFSCPAEGRRPQLLAHAGGAAGGGLVLPAVLSTPRMKRDQVSQASGVGAEAELPPRSFLGEVWDFTRANKKWWIAPLILVLLLLGALIAIGGGRRSTRPKST